MGQIILTYTVIKNLIIV